MQSGLARLGHVQLAIDESSNHLGDLLEPSKDDLVALHEPVALVPDLRLLAEGAHERLCLPEVVARHAGEEMVHSLELESTV